jgi:hypothetical protein
MASPLYRILNAKLELCIVSERRNPDERRGDGRARKMECLETMQLWRRRNDDRQNLHFIVNNICNIMCSINVGGRGRGIGKVQNGCTLGQESGLKKNPQWY